MTLLDIYNTSLTADFIKQVESAMYSAAIAIVGEDGYGSSAGRTAKRHSLGVKILNGDSRALPSFVKAVASNVGDVANPSSLSDATISTSVASVFDDIAGVLFTEV